MVGELVVAKEPISKKFHEANHSPSRWILHNGNDIVNHSLMILFFVQCAERTRRSLATCISTLWLIPWFKHEARKMPSAGLAVLSTICRVELRMSEPYRAMYSCCFLVAAGPLGVFGADICAKIWLLSYMFSITRSGVLMKGSATGKLLGGRQSWPAAGIEKSQIVGMSGTQCHVSYRDSKPSHSTT